MWVNLSENRGLNITKLLLIWLIVGLQEPAVEQAGKATLTGVVARIGTGDPLTKAQLRLTPWDRGGNQPTITAITDSGGRFVLSEVVPGKYRLRVTRNSYVRQAYLAKRPGGRGKGLELVAGEEKELLILMSPAPTISGRVFDMDGEPLANVTVEALEPRYGSDGKKTLVQTKRAVTNDLGEYRLFWLTPGDYFLSATRNGNRSNSNLEVYVPIYYPNVTDPGSAAALTLSSGNDLPAVDLTFRPVRSVAVSGTVFDTTTGEPVRGVALGIYRNDGLARAVRTGARTDSEGRFELRGVTSGSLVIRASFGPSRDRYETALPIEVSGADVRDLVLMIGPGLAIEGQLYFEGTATGAVSTTIPDDAGVTVFLRQAQNSVLTMPSATPDESGKFTLENVPVGAYQLWVTGLDPNYYVKRALLGSEEIPASRVVIDARSTPALSVLISPNAGVLDGTVTGLDEDTFGSARVVLVPEDRLRRRTILYRISAVDETGRFSMSGIVPGDYTIFAWEELEGSVYFDPDFIRRFETQGEPVRIEEGSHPSVTIRVAKF